MTYLVSNAETAEDIMRCIKSGTVDVPEWAIKLAEYAEQQSRLYSQTLDEYLGSED